MSDQSDATDREQSDADQATAKLDRAELRDQATTNQVETTRKLDQLIKESHGVVESSRALIESNQKVAESSDRYSLAMVAHQERARLAARRYRVTVAVLVIGLALLAWRQDAADTSSRDARHTIIDCVTPQGQCYKDSQARTGDAIGSITQVTVLAAACAPDYVRLPLARRIVAIQKCIEDKLGSAPAGPIGGHQPTPTQSSTPTPTLTATATATATRTVTLPGIGSTVTRTVTRTRTVTATTTKTAFPLPSPLCTVLNVLPLC